MIRLVGTIPICADFPLNPKSGKVIDFKIDVSSSPAPPLSCRMTGGVVSLLSTPLGNCVCPDFYRITIFNGVLSTAVKYLPDGRIDPNSLDRTNVI
jgi:hypothetical protein